MMWCNKLNQVKNVGMTKDKEAVGQGIILFERTDMPICSSGIHGDIPENNGQCEKGDLFHP